MNIFTKLLATAWLLGAGAAIAAPDPVVELAPTGTVADNEPTYEWEAVAGATHYGLWVRTQSGDPVIRNKWYSASAASCSTAAICRLTPPFPLQNGTYRWWIRAINASSSPSQKGPWTKPGIFFTVDSGEPSVPSRVVLTGIDSGSPGASTPVLLNDNTPVFKWAAQSGVDDYLIKYHDEDGNPTSSIWISAANANCSSGSGTCSYSFPGNFKPGEYRWWMKARNSTGTGLWTIGVFRFSVEVKIMPLGDSITEGVFGEKSYRKPLIDDFDLTGCHYQMVGSRTENDTPTGFESPHEGYSGHRVDYFVEGNASEGNPGINAIMSAQNPDVVLVHLGSNDLNNSQPVTGAYKANGSGGTISELQELAAKIFAANPDAEIFVANVIPWFGNSSNSDISSDIDDLGDAIELWINSAGNSQLHLVDVRSGYTASDMTTDLIHPNASGDARIADAFLSELAASDFCD